MKCPTCGYIGFETTDRCRNCGYEFALASTAPAAPDFADQVRRRCRGPAARARHAASGTASRGRRGHALGERDGSRSRAAESRSRARRPRARRADLPLFDDRDDADLAPVVVPGVAPRRPLSVRRTTPEPTRLKAGRSRPPADAAPRSLELPLPDRVEPESEAAHRVVSAEAEPGEGAPPLRRFGAAALDVAIIGAIDAIVVSFTLRLCGLTTAELSIVPPLPMLVFSA